MRTKYWSRKSEGDESAASSVKSEHSYELFGSSCSDSEAECQCEVIKQHSNSFTSFLSICTMDRYETAPLLKTNPAPSYSAIGDSSDSLGPGEISDKDVISTYNKYRETPENTRSRSKKQSSLVTIFSVWNTIMGSSLLTMAWGVEQAGLPAALILVAFMAALCLYTAYILLTVNRHHGTSTCEVPALCRALLGRWAEVIAHCFSLVVLLGANVVYWILITNFLYYTVNYFTDMEPTNSSSLLCPSHAPLLSPPAAPAPPPWSPLWSPHSTVPLYVAVGVFPLLHFKDVTFFTKFNSLGTLSVLYLLIFVTVKAAAWGINISTVAGDTHAAKNAAVLSGMLALSFYIHNIIITIMSNNSKQENNARDLTIAFVLVTLTYTLVGAVFYICFPLAKSCIEDNLLNNFEMHDIMTAVARMLLLFQVVTVYPLVAFMLRSEAILLLPFRETRCLIVCINTVIVAVCILVACLLPNIGTIIRYTGAVSGLVHIFALPSLLQIRSLQLRGDLTCWKIIFYGLIVTFGAVNLMMQFFIDE